MTPRLRVLGMTNGLSGLRFGGIGLHSAFYSFSFSLGNAETDIQWSDEAHCIHDRG